MFLITFLYKNFSVSFSIVSEENRGTNEEKKDPKIGD